MPGNDSVKGTPEQTLVAVDAGVRVGMLEQGVAVTYVNCALGLPLAVGVAFPDGGVLSACQVIKLTFGAVLPRKRIASSVPSGQYPLPSLLGGNA